MDSDIDLVVLTTQKAAYSDSEEWASVAVSQPAELIRTQEWGPLMERRIRVASGLEIEFGLPRHTGPRQIPWTQGRRLSCPTDVFQSWIMASCSRGFLKPWRESERSWPPLPQNTGSEAILRPAARARRRGVLGQLMS